MSENKTTIFSTKLVDTTGLQTFWGKVQKHYGDADKGIIGNVKAELVEEINKANTAIEGLTTLTGTHTTDIADLQTAVDALVGGDGQGGVSISDMIQAKIDDFKSEITDVIDSRVETNKGNIENLQTTVDEHGEAITELQNVTNGVVESINDVNSTIEENERVTAEALNDHETRLATIEGQDVYIAQDVAVAINNAKEDANDYTDTALAEHENAVSVHPVGATGEAVLKSGKIHVTAEDRYNWDLAASRIETFLNATETEDAIDNLTHINKWFNEHGTAYSELFDTVQTNTGNITTNTNNLADLITNLQNVTIAGEDDITAIFTK